MSGKASSEKKGLRERLKDVVREQIRDAAFVLFAKNGFDGVLVEEIAEAADVSTRTFFRYFPTKEDVALQWLDDTGPLIRERLRTQPEDVPLATALSRAFTLSSTHPDLVQHATFIEQLTTESPRLRAGVLLRQQSWIDELRIVIADRMGLPHETLEPRLWATIAVAVVTTSSDWAAANDESQEETMHRAFALTWGADARDL